MSYSSRGRKVRRRRKNLNIRNLIILVAGFVVTILLLVLLVHGAVRLVSKGIGALTGDGEGTSGQSSTVSGEDNSSEPASEPAVSWTSVEMTEADEREGNLILVNGSHEYTAEPEDMTVLYGNKSNSYGLKVAEMYLKTPALTALNNMMDGFQEATGIGSTRSAPTAPLRNSKPSTMKTSPTPPAPPLTRWPSPVTANTIPVTLWICLTAPPPATPTWTAPATTLG